MSSTLPTTTNKAQAAILVDYDLYSYHPHVRRWLKLREDSAALVMLVNDPEHNDYDPLSTRWRDDPRHADFTVVIRNSGAKKSIHFKYSALTVVKDLSNLIPVIALDKDQHVQQMYEDNGVLIAQDEENCFYV